MIGPRLEIDLAAFRRNIDVLRARVGPADLMLVVKNDAYGHGLSTIATAAADAGIRSFATSDLATGLATRAVVPADTRVLAWPTGERSLLADAIAAEIEIGVGDFELLALLIDRHATRRTRVHLEVDTGLSRGGFRPDQWNSLASTVSAAVTSGAIELAGVWSHIAEASDDDDDDARSRYDEAVHALTTAGLTPGIRHLAASAASWARPEFRYDAVRIGAFAYGIRPAGGPDSATLGIRPIARLLAPVVAVDDAAVTVAVGSRDGLFSSLAGAVDVATSAGLRPLREVGAEVSRVGSWPGARVGDTVEIFGPAVEPTALAEAVGTIGEEVVTRIAPWVPRTTALSP
ncbi:alanine racemase [Microcella alkaliphila]|nr:alanine racemase [Microcella alkaliphila]